MLGRRMLTLLARPSGRDPALTPHDPRRAHRLCGIGTRRRGRLLRPSISPPLSGEGTRRAVRNHPRGSAALGLCGQCRWRADPRARAGPAPPGGVCSGRNPSWRDRREGRRVHPDAGAAAGHRTPGRTPPADLRPGADLQRRRARASSASTPTQPERAAGTGLAGHRPEPEPQSRLDEGRCPRDAGPARAPRGLGSNCLPRSARHRRCAVRARRLPLSSRRSSRALRRCRRWPGFFRTPCTRISRPVVTSRSTSTPR